MSPFAALEKISADPAANNELIFTADENMIVRSLAFQLATDATAANRRVELVADDGADVFFRSPAISDQAASLTHDYSAWSGSPQMAVQDLTHLIGFPEGGIFLPKNGRIRTITTNRQAGDNFGPMTLNVERI